MLLLLLSLAAQAASPMSVSLRYRSLWLPDSIMDTWYFNKSEGAPLARPSVGAHAFGLEYALEPEHDVYTFYVEYLGADIEPGYWDDREDPPAHFDGDWVTPEGVGMVALGANFGREFAITPREKDVWLGFIAGGGLGIGVPTGHMDRWKNWAAEGADQSCGLNQTAIDRQDICEPDDTLDLWPVIPVVDVTTSLRVHVKEYGVARFDFGFHDMLYLGGAVGGAF